MIEYGWRKKHHLFLAPNLKGIWQPVFFLASHIEESYLNKIWKLSDISTGNQTHSNVLYYALIYEDTFSVQQTGILIKWHLCFDMWEYFSHRFLAFRHIIPMSTGIDVNFQFRACENLCNQHFPLWKDFTFPKIVASKKHLGPLRNLLSSGVGVENL